MSPPVRLALLGFTTFESDHLRASLGPEAGARVVYVQTDDLAGSSLAVVNADHEPSVAEVLRRHRLPTTVMLGTTPRPGAAAHLRRPFQPALLRRTLDGLALATPPVSAGVQRVQQELARLGGGRLQLNPPRRERATAAMPLIQGPSPDASPWALVVDESDVRLRALATHLQPQGIALQLARSAPDAIERVVAQRPRWLFVMTGLDSLDGYHTCRLVRHAQVPEDQRPHITLLLAQDGAVDRLRAQLAGADATLAWPLNAAALQGVLACATAVPAVDKAEPALAPYIL